MDALSFDELILATGSKPRSADIQGIGHSMVCNYVDVLNGRIAPGKSIAIVGAGGIAIDTALFCLHGSKPASIDDFTSQWGIDSALENRGGLLPSHAVKPPDRKIFMLQRSDKKPGALLGKTTAWIHRAELKQAGVEVLNKVQYRRIHDGGIDLEQNGKPITLPVDQVIICAGQQPDDSLYEDLLGLQKPIHRIGGALRSDELNAHRAIEEGTRLGMMI
jgi:2,4-dienoyl-CoA reductase (NADPH2)